VNPCIAHIDGIPELWRRVKTSGWQNPEYPASLIKTGKTGPPRNGGAMKLWSIFSVYDEGAKTGINPHYRFNLVKVTLHLLAQNSRELA
jgi:hypothetical protein